MGTYVWSYLVYIINCLQSQQPEINDQYVKNTVPANTIPTNNISEPETHEINTETPADPRATENDVTVPPSTTQHEIIKATEEIIYLVKAKNETTSRIPENQTAKTRRDFSVVHHPKPNCFVRIYEIISSGIDSFITTPKVNTVLKNIGVCIVNGVMEIITFYIPAPFIPLIASAAGMVIPFEPVVMLREKMPMKNYRRALDKAVNGFLGTFDRFAVHDEDDPYMTRRFNRRFMGNSKEELTTKRNGVDED